MKLQIAERYDSPKLIKLFNQLKDRGYNPLWIDPYNKFVVNTKNGVIVYSQINNGKLTKTVLDNEFTF